MSTMAAIAPRASCSALAGTGSGFDQQGTLEFGRELTPLPGPLLRGHPSPTVQIDCILRQNLPTFCGLLVDRAKNPADAAVHSSVRSAGRRRWPILTTSGGFRMPAGWTDRIEIATQNVVPFRGEPCHCPQSMTVGLVLVHWR